LHEEVFGKESKDCFGNKPFFSTSFHQKHIPVVEKGLWGLGLIGQGMNHETLSGVLSVERSI
jgi:hypothetical protein